MPLSRRELLGLGIGGLTYGLTAGNVAAQDTHERLILITLVGGPSQLDTWDPKPDAPSEYRGPFSTIPTRVPGLRFSELFPRTAAMADRLTTIRSVYHEEAPVHEVGLQLLHAGTATHDGGRVIGLADRVRDEFAAGSDRLLPGPCGYLGIDVPHGQGRASGSVATSVSAAGDDVSGDPLRERFGHSSFGDDCLRALRMIESGVRFVNVNMFTGVYDTVSWDCHASEGSLSSTLNDYREIAPRFDAAFSALVDTLDQAGMLRSTAVVACGEFGRTPKLNHNGGRDHWAGAWSALAAGAGWVRGAVIGSTDRYGGEPTADAISLPQLHEKLRSIVGV